MSGIRRLVSIYGRIFRTLLAWARSLLLLATIVFVPLGLLDALAFEANFGSIDHNGFHLAAAIGATAAITVTALFGEVFYSGAVAVSLTHPEHGQAPPLREIAGRLRYRRLIAIDLLFDLLVAIGLALLVVPGIAVFVWLGLAGPVVEIEGQTIRGALARSCRLIRGSFWTVFFVLVPVEVAGDELGNLIDDLLHHVFGAGLLATWAGESLSNILFTPVFAVAAVLLTLELIAKRDGSGPSLNPAPTPSALPA